MIPGDCGCGQEEHDSLTSPSIANNTIDSPSRMDTGLTPVRAATVAASLAIDTTVISTDINILYSGTSDSANQVLGTNLMVNINNTDFPISLPSSIPM